MEGQRKFVHFELNVLFARESKCFAHIAKNTSTGVPVVMGMVHARIGELAFKERLKKMDARMKRCF